MHLRTYEYLDLQHLLMQALMVIWDLMASHHKMTAWHEIALDVNMSALGKLREAKRACHARIRQAYLHNPNWCIQICSEVQLI